MKQLIYFILLFTAIFFSCEKDSTDNMTAEIVLRTNNNPSIDLFYNGNDISRINLQIFEGLDTLLFENYINGDSITTMINFKNIISFKMNLPRIVNKENINVYVENKAFQLSKQIGDSDIMQMNSMINNLPTFIFDEVGEQDYIQILPQSLFYQISLLKTTKRSIYSNNFKCGESLVFQNDEAPFHCYEDRLVSKEDLRAKILYKVDSFNGQEYNFYPYETISFLDSELDSIIEIYPIDIKLRQEFNEFWNQQLTNAQRQSIQNNNTSGSNYAPIDPTCHLYGASEGSDCGCCGNYSGSCWKCWLECYVHDRMCVECTPRWFCLSGCKPGPC